MKIPRDISGYERTKLFKKYDCSITCQTESHIRLTTNLKDEHRITIPNHDALKIGALNNIFNRYSKLSGNRQTIFN